MHMSRTLTTLSLAAAAVLALSSCATPDHTSHGVVPVAQAGTPTPASTPSSTHAGHSPDTHSGHSPSTPPSASVSESASADHSEHVDKIETYDGKHRENDHHSKRDDTYKDVAVEDGTTYTIQSSTDATKFKLTIESFECKDPFPKAGITASGKAARFKAGDGKMLCVAMVSGENVGKKPDHAALNYFTVALVDGTEYEETDSPDFTTQFLLDGKTPLDQPVDPGDTGWIALGYELPTSAQDISLRIDTAPASY
jgi:hypothetical protein